MRQIPSDEDIRNKPWPPIHIEEAASNEYFIFLSVDVIGHSKLFNDNMDDVDLLERHELLLKLRQFVRECFQNPWDDNNGLEWDWAGDGGIYAIPERFPDRRPVDKALLVAIKIADEIDDFNSKSDLDPIALRIVLDYGKGYRYPDKELRRGTALNFVAKLRVPGKRTSITVTRELLDKLRCRPRSDFYRIDVSEQTDRDVYVHLPTHLNALHAEVKATEARDAMQAAHLAYRLGVLYFGAGEQQFAIHQFERAISLIDKVRNPHRYYTRTMREFYSLWRTLAIDISEEELARADANDRRKTLRELEERGFFKKYDHPEAWNLLHEMEFCLEQMDILAHRPVSDPIGLTSLQICLALERVGYPRQWHGAAISERITRIKAELEESRMWAENEGGFKTVDMACGLCSGVAASCLALDDDDASTPLVAWLMSKGDSHYTYRGQTVPSRVRSDEHAMHYAAAVLQAFVDDDVVGNAAAISDVLGAFFDGVAPQDKRLPRRWVTYRNISVPDFCGIVFPPFARTIMACGSLGDTKSAESRTEVVREALNAMARLLVAEAKLGGLSKSPGRLYAARDNLGTFGLALLVGMPEKAVAIFHGLRRGMSAAASDNLPDQQRRRTTDSNLDRIRKWLDGWLLQWECALYLRDNGREILPEEIQQYFRTGPKKIN
jgi:tetratricopeptide (TPR) repeat protein